MTTPRVVELPRRRAQSGPDPFAGTLPLGAPARAPAAAIAARIARDAAQRGRASACTAPAVSTGSGPSRFSTA